MNDENKEKNFISAVVYVHNSEKEIETFLTMVHQYLSETFRSYEMICVNDVSTDKSADVIRKFASEHGDCILSVITMSYYQGLELSMDAGVDLAIGDFVYEFDSAVISYPEDMLRKVYDKCLSGFDIVSACPKDSGHKASAMFYRIYNKNSSAQYKLRTEAFRILSRRSINRVQSMSRTLPYRKAVYANCGLPTAALYYDAVKDIPVVEGEEKSAQKDTAINALILYTNIAYKFSMGFSIFMLCVTVAVTVYAFVTYFTVHPVAGWTTTILFLSFCFFGVSVLLTILIKYAELTLKTVFTKQKYVLESIDKYGN